MSKDLDVFFSNRLEVLYQALKQNLFGSSSTPFARRLIVVYGPTMKTWLMLRMAQDPELNVATGLEFVYFNQAFEFLLKLAHPQNKTSLPSLLELSLAIEKEFMFILHNYKELTLPEQKEWAPLLHYLKLDPYHLKPLYRLSRKMEKRLIGLSQQMAHVFQEYGRYGEKMVTKWEKGGGETWQARLWRKLFNAQTEWTYPASLFQKSIGSMGSCILHLFSISFVTAQEFLFLRRLSEHISVNYYLLSPCAVFWSDIRSDRENAYLQALWQRKLGPFSPPVLQLEELLRDRNPLLANFGRLGRAMAQQIEESQAQTKAHYVLPAHTQELDEELGLQEDLSFLETSTPLTLLHALQADLLLMRQPSSQTPYAFAQTDGSFQVHMAANRRREVQILYHNILQLMAKDPSLEPGDIIVLAPQIADYVPYIQSFFGSENSQLECQILDLGMQMQSEIARGFLQLLTLSESRWESSQLLQLFEHPLFQQKHQLTLSDYTSIREWIEQAGIRWGDDWLHRNELLQQRHCSQKMVEETAIGTWDYGLSRLLMGLTTLLNTQTADLVDTLPCESMEFSQGELLGRWIRLLHSLRDDLTPLQDRTRMTMIDWVNYFLCLLENYFQPNYEEAQSVEDYEDLKAQFETLRSAAYFCAETLFPFASFKMRLLHLLQARGLSYHENHVQVVRFCSLVPLRSIPARVIVLLGMQEGNFPRSTHYSSLNLLTKQEERDYSPSSADYDRYLFLEALHSAQDYLLISYQGYHARDSKELQPALVVDELLNYVDQFYTIAGQKVSDTCVFKHPFDAFDWRYFQKSSRLANFSFLDFRVAQAHYHIQKTAPYRFFHAFNYLSCPSQESLPSHSQIDLKFLSAAARNPIRLHLNKSLEIYLQKEEDRKIKTEEELFLSTLNRYQLKQFAIKEPLEKVLVRAEKEGKLPFGLFKTVATKRLKEEVNFLHERLQKYAIDPQDIFEIEFCPTCSQPVQLERSHWLFPPVKITYEEGYTLSIVGKLKQATSKGLLVMSSGTLADAWKTWPQFLLYCAAAKQQPQLLKPQLILAQAAQPKEAFFTDPIPYLKQFMHYYTFCLKNFSPLLPEWLTLILEEDHQGLHGKMRQLFGESFGLYQNEDLRWILSKHYLPNSEKMVEEWKEPAKQLLGDLMRFWYNTKAVAVKEES